MLRWMVLCAVASPAAADTLVTTRTIRAQTVLELADLGLISGKVDGALTAPEQAIGMEARVTLYPGRPIRHADLGPHAVINRNQIVPLAYLAGPLAILTEGRALARAGVGDSLRVMNLASRSTVTGRVRADGTVIVGP